MADGGELNLIDNELAKIMPVSGHGFSDFVNNAHIRIGINQSEDRAAKQISKWKWNRFQAQNI